MSERKDIIGAEQFYDPEFKIQHNLIYTSKCGWIDLGHANPRGHGFIGAENLWRQIKMKTGRPVCYPDDAYAEIIYQQGMGISPGVRAGIQDFYLVKKEIFEPQQKSIALAIFYGVSMEFEGVQASWPYRWVTNSGYSVEDLVSDLIGFYRAVNPGTDYIALCGTIASKEDAENIWDYWGPVGSHKNTDMFHPMLFPIPEEIKIDGTSVLGPALEHLKVILGPEYKYLKIIPGPKPKYLIVRDGKQPTKGNLPQELNAIKPAPKGRLWQGPMPHSLNGHYDSGSYLYDIYIGHSPLAEHPEDLQ